MFVAGSPVHVGYSGYNGGHLNGSYRNGGGNSSLTSSPYKSFSASPLSAKYTAASPGGAPARGHGFDPRTFTRSSAARAGAYSIPPEDEEGKARKTSYHRLNFGAKTDDGNVLNTTYERGKEAGGNSTFTTSDKMDGTFNKTSDMLTDNQCNELNSTYDRNVLIKDGLNSTFTRNGSDGNNVTFERGGNNATFNRGDIQNAALNSTFDKEAGGHGSANHRKMSEDRLSSASSRYQLSVDLFLFPELSSAVFVFLINVGRRDKMG